MHPLTTYAALLSASGDDPMVRWDVDPEHCTPAWSHGSAVAFVRRGRSFRTSLTVVGPPDNVAAMLDRDGLLPGDVHGITVTAACRADLERAYDVGPGGDWEWLWTEAEPPVVAGEDAVVPVDDDPAAVTALLDAASPRASVRPADGRARGWLGVRVDGVLVACGADEGSLGGVAHLAGIATHPAYRGRGFGRAVTAAWTRRAVRRYGVCTLGMYADNAVARGMYLSLGYRVAHALVSRQVSTKTG